MTRAKPSGPMSKFQPKPLDHDLFFQLFDILHDGCMDGNWSATARLLGVTTRTARLWSKTPPKFAWINHILHQCITEVYHSMTHSKHKKIRRKAEKVAGQLARSDLHSLQEYLQYNEANNENVKRALFVEMLSLPDEGTTLNELRKPGRIGAYSERAIRGAAQDLGLIIETRGFGADKKTHYRLPTEDDL